MALLVLLEQSVFSAFIVGHALQLLREQCLTSTRSSQECGRTSFEDTEGTTARLGEREAEGAKKTVVSKLLS